VLGVDENPMRANWHRATIVVCKNCRREINALRTISPRTQLTLWLAAVPLHGVEVATVDLGSTRTSTPCIRRTTRTRWQEGTRRRRR